MSEHGRFFGVFLYVCLQEHLQKHLGQQIITATKKTEKKNKTPKWGKSWNLALKHVIVLNRDILFSLHNYEWNLKV